MAINNCTDFLLQNDFSITFINIILCSFVRCKCKSDMFDNYPSTFCLHTHTYVCTCVTMTMKMRIFYLT